jgi:hypothetical protein
MLNENITFEEVVLAATRSWPTCYGDSNLSDVFWLAQAIAAPTGTLLPGKEPPKHVGITIVDCVESLVIQRRLIRTVPPHELAGRARTIGEEILKRKFIENPPESSVQASALSLFTWHGCISMAKSLRSEDVRGCRYTLNMRHESYTMVLQTLECALPEGRRWIRYGISLAKGLEEKRGNRVIDDWVPKDSPYWL